MASGFSFGCSFDSEAKYRGSRVLCRISGHETRRNRMSLLVNLAVSVTEHDEHHPFKLHRISTMGSSYLDLIHG